jgi:hypothetical protein
MKATTHKTFALLVGILLTAPFFATAIVVGARVIRMDQSMQDNWWIIALALGGALVSIINGSGRRGLRLASGNRAEGKAQAYPQAASSINSAINL